MLLPKQYTSALDLWSAGCILCEIIGRKVLFPGKNHVDMIRRITEVLGTPPESDVTWLPKSSDAHRFLFQVCPKSNGQPLKDLYPKATAPALALAAELLHWDPDKRITAADGLKHEYLKGFFQKEDAVPFEPFDWSFDNFKKNSSMLREKLYLECARFNPEINERDGFPYGAAYARRSSGSSGGGGGYPSVRPLTSRSVTPPSSARRTVTPPRAKDRSTTPLAVAARRSSGTSGYERSATPPRTVTPQRGTRSSTPPNVPARRMSAERDATPRTGRDVTPPGGRDATPPPGERDVTPPGGRRKWRMDFRRDKTPPREKTPPRNGTRRE